jgi:hypothetical protein
MLLQRLINLQTHYQTLINQQFGDNNFASCLPHKQKPPRVVLPNAVQKQWSCSLWQNKVIETDYAQQLRDALGMICKTNMQ